MTSALLRFETLKCVLFRVLLSLVVLRKLAKNLENKKRNGDSGTTATTPVAILSPMREKINSKSQIELNDKADKARKSVVYYLCTTNTLSRLSFSLLFSQGRSLGRKKYPCGGPLTSNFNALMNIKKQLQRYSTSSRGR